MSKSGSRPSQAQPAVNRVSKEWIFIVALMPPAQMLVLWLVSPEEVHLWLFLEPTRNFYIGLILWNFAGVALLTRLRARSRSLFAIWVFAALAIFAAPALLVPYVGPDRLGGSIGGLGMP